MRSKITSNLILEQLPSELRQQLASNLRPHWLRKGEEIPLGAEVVFPLGAVISLIDNSPHGVSVEPGFVGFEGVLAIGAVQNIKAEVQITGEALSLPRSVYEELQDNREFRRVTDAYRDRLLGLAFQTAVCLVSHRTEQRLATSLLAMSDRCGQEHLELTQEYLAALMGVRRPTVTIAAGVLQAGGLIHHRYGKVAIDDAAGLADAACPCLAEIRQLSATAFAVA